MITTATSATAIAVGQPQVPVAGESSPRAIGVPQTQSSSKEGLSSPVAPEVELPGLLTADRILKAFETADDHYLELKSFPTLTKTAKFKTHDSVVIAADTGTGKSSLALNFLYDLQEEYPSLYINLEMDELTIYQRLIAIHTGIELDRIEGYKHDEITRKFVAKAAQEIASRQRVQVLTDAYDLSEIEKQIKTATTGRKETTLVFVDTGLLVNTDRTTSRYERFTMISEEFRKIARRYNIILFILLQQSREGKKDDTEPPKNGSLKESGSWENDAPKIIFLWQNPKTAEKELVITKNRNGELGRIKLNYYRKTQTYREVTDGQLINLDEKKEKQERKSFFHDKDIDASGVYTPYIDDANFPYA